MKKIISKKSLITLGFCIATSPLVANAATEVESSEILVSATKTQKELQEVVSSVAVVTEQDIERSGSATVADMLKDVPGVEVTDTGTPGAKRIKIRGESGARVLVMVDGQKVGEQKSMDGAPLLVDPSIIERIEVIKGPSSVLYGSEAIGGVVNIITKKGGEDTISGSASLLYNSSTSGFEEAVSVYGTKNGFSYRLGASHADHGDRRTGSGRLENSEFMNRNVNGFLGYENENISVGLTLEDTYSESEAPDNIGDDGTIVRVNLPEWSRQKAGMFFDIKDVNDFIPRIHFDGYVQRTDKDFENDIITPGMQMEMRTRNKQDSYGFNSQIDITPHDDHYVIAGFSATHEVLDAQGTTDMTMGNMPFPTTTSFQDAEVTTYALYAQDEWSLPNDFMFTFGGRQTWVSSELKDSSDLDQIGKTNDSKAVFSAGLTWTGVDDLTLRGLFSQGYRFPDLDKLFIGTSHGGSVPTQANPDLKPETSNNFELGARYNTDSWTVDVSSFVNFAENYIARQEYSDGGVDWARYENIDKAKTIGLEAYVGYTIANLHLTPYASGNWMKREFEYEDYSTWHTKTPALSGRVGVKYERSLESSPASLWSDFYVRAATEAKEETTQGDIDITPAWQTLNFSVGTDFGVDRQYQASLNFNNILDQSYETAAATLEEAGFHVVARLAVSF